MAELTERELRDKQRGLKALNSRDAASMDLQRRHMAIWDDDDRPSSVKRYNVAKAELSRLDAQVTARLAEIKSIDTQLTNIKDAETKKKELKKLKIRKNN
jgi:hypothetical protein